MKKTAEAEPLAYDLLVKMEAEEVHKEVLATQPAASKGAALLHALHPIAVADLMGCKLADMNSTKLRALYAQLARGERIGKQL